MTKDQAINKVLTLARNEIGYKEKNSNIYLDDKNANAGSGNYTKYARDLDALSDFYNGRKQGVSWCDIFVDWCFVQAFGREKHITIPTRAGIGNPTRKYAVHYERQKQDRHSQHLNYACKGLRYFIDRVP